MRVVASLCVYVLWLWVALTRFCYTPHPLRLLARAIVRDDEEGLPKELRATLGALGE